MSQFNINDEVALSDGTTLTFGNAVSVFVSDVRETNDISWSVLDFTQLSGDAIRKRASRLYSTSITVVEDDEGVGFNFTKDGKKYYASFSFLGNQLKYNGVAKVGKVKTVAPKKEAVTEDIFAKAKPAESKPVDSGRVKTQFMMTPNSIVIVKDGQPFIVNHDHINFGKIKAQLEEDSTYLPKLLEPAKVLEEFSHMGLSYKNGMLKLDGYNFQSQMFDRLIQAIQEQEPEDTLKKLFAFVRRAMEHPVKETAERLFDFARCNSIEITDEGMLICYKKVRSDYMDIHSNTMRNKPGDVLRVPRWAVDDDHNQTCSRGLHVCSSSYLPHFSSNSSTDRIVSVLVDPVDFMAVPYDYKDAKARTVGYTVLEDITDKMKK